MSWVLGIVGAILISVLVDIILPNGQINKYIKGIFSLLFIYMLISPLVGFVKAGANMDFDIFQTNNYYEDTTFVQSINADRLEELQQNLIKTLEENKIFNTNVVIFSQANNINLIDYAVIELEQELQKEKKELVYSLASAKLNIPKEKISIYITG